MIAMTDIAAKAESEGMAQVGNSGRYYIKNTYGKGDYEYAMYPSKRHYLRITAPTYISNEQRMEDLDTTQYYEFIVKTPTETKTYYTDLYGKLLDDDSTMEEMLELLYSINGRDNVSFKFEKCITTSLSSLV